jgi:hypothetical protein
VLSRAGGGLTGLALSLPDRNPVVGQFIKSLSDLPVSGPRDCLCHGLVLARLRVNAERATTRRFPMTTTAPRCLVIGSKGHLHAKCVDWKDDPLPALPDYDVAIVNVRSLDHETLAQIPYVRLKEICLALLRLLESKGEVMVLSDFHRTMQPAGKELDPRYQQEGDRGREAGRPYQKELRTISNYSWSPINIQLREEAGETIKVCHNHYKSYFARFKEMSQWQYYFLENQQGFSLETLAHYMQKYPSLRYKVHFTPLMENRYDEALCVRYHYEIFHSEAAKADYAQKTADEEKPRLVSGSFTVLPLLADYDDREAVNIILEDVTGKPHESLPPNWVKNIEMPGMSKLNKEIQVNKNQIKYMEKVIRHLESSKAELEQYKKILYTTGSELHHIFDLCATKLGATVKKSKYGNEERILEYGHNRFLVYIKARENAISLSDLRILSDHSLLYEEDTKSRIKAVLFGNAWRSMQLSKRDSKDMPYFSESVLDRARQFDIALVASCDFFDVFCKFIEKADGADGILQAMVTQTGRVRFETPVEASRSAGGE